MEEQIKELLRETEQIASESQLIANSLSARFPESLVIISIRATAVNLLFAIELEKRKLGLLINQEDINEELGFMLGKVLEFREIAQRNRQIIRRLIDG
jgi:hypothetical protein